MAHMNLQENESTWIASAAYNMITQLKDICCYVHFNINQGYVLSEQERRQAHEGNFRDSSKFFMQV